MDRDLVIHSYDVAIQRFARIMYFNFSRYKTSESEAYSIAGKLFLDDILMFAISFRRLIDISGLRKDVSSIVFERHSSSGNRIRNAGLVVVDLCNALIHSEDVRIVSNQAELSVLRGEKFDLMEFIKDRNKPIEDPLLFVRSSELMILISISDMIEKLDWAVSRTVDIIQDKNIFLEAAYRGGD